MSHITTILLASAAVALIFYAAGIACALVHLRRRHRPAKPDALPPISLLKPLKGPEEDLEGCLRSFFEQDYPAPFEVVFATANLGDSALATARRVAAAYPHVRSRFVLSDENWGLNPKVSNLQGALSAARFDLALQTDANVWAPPDYLRTIVSEFVAEKASLLSSLVSGIGERSAGAAMENLQLTAYVAPACCAALKLAGVPCVIGKSMLFRRSELKSLGGLELVKDSLCEDFLLGRHYAESGKKVVLSATPIRNVNVRMGIDRSLSRHARWLKMRAVIHVPGFIADLFANPLGLTLLAWVSSGFEPVLAAAALAVATIKATTEALVVRLVRGSPMRLTHTLWSPVKDVLMLGVWIYAIFSRTIEWRGIRFRLGNDSQLLPDQGALPVRVLRRLWNT